MEEARDLKFEDINVGDSTSFSHTITEQDVLDFARLSGDYNPLHIDEAYAARTQFGKPIAHGMFLGALCSRLIGMYLPGKRSLYLSQNLQFKNPAYRGDTIEIVGTVAAKSESIKILDIEMIIKKGDLILAHGLAKIRVLEPNSQSEHKRKK
jgi:acyl dehydratase